MIELKCPAEWDFRTAGLPNFLFLGGGITGTPNWQMVMVELLKDTNLVLVNPRRDDFDVNDPTMTEKQIKWEYNYLKLAAGRLFWFPCETLCPITLFELGKFIEKAEPLFVGCHPDYQRKKDLEIQIGLARPWNTDISYSLDGLADRVKKWSAR